MTVLGLLNGLLLLLGDRVVAAAYDNDARPDYKRLVQFCPVDAVREDGSDKSTFNTGGHK